MPQYKKTAAQLYAFDLIDNMLQIRTTVCLCEDKERLREFVVSWHNGPSSDVLSLGGSTGTCYIVLNENGSQYPVVALPFKWTNSVDNIAILTHEILHASLSICKIRQITLPKNVDVSINDEEFLCYYTTWLMTGALNSLACLDEYKVSLDSEKEIININEKATDLKSGHSKKSPNTRKQT